MQNVDKQDDENNIANTKATQAKKKICFIQHAHLIRDTWTTWHKTTAIKFPPTSKLFRASSDTQWKVYSHKIVTTSNGG